MLHARRVVDEAEHIGMASRASDLQHLSARSQKSSRDSSRSFVFQSQLPEVWVDKAAGKLFGLNKNCESAKSRNVSCGVGAVLIRSDPSSTSNNGEKVCGIRTEYLVDLV